MKLITSQTPIGDFHMMTHEVRGVDTVRVSGFGDVEDLRKRLPQELQDLELQEVRKHPYQRYITEYFAGDAAALDAIPKHQSGTEFQESVWRVMSNIKPGETLSYKQLAEKSGNAAAIRAAGTICGLNRLVLLVPCHRILKSDGAIGNYLYGADVKRFLLELEGVSIE